MRMRLPSRRGLLTAALAAGLLAALFAVPVRAQQPQPEPPATQSAPAGQPAPAAQPSAPTQPTAPLGGTAPADTGLGVPITPNAAPLVDATGPPAPAIVGSGADALVRPPQLRADNDPTLLERYGSAGHTLDTQLGFGEQTEEALNAIAGGIFAIATWLAQAAIATFQWAFTVELFDFVGDAVDGIVDQVEQAIYVPFVGTAVVLAGLWLAWHGLVRRRATAAGEGFVWTVAALAAGALFLLNPGAVVDAANALSGGLARGVLAGVSVADPKTGPDDGVETTATFDGSAADTQLRVSGDRFWRVFVHQPWLVLQFGDLEAGRRFGERLLAAKTITEEEYAATEGDPDELAALGERKRADYEAVQEEILADPAMAEWFRGQRGIERLGVATLALVGVAVGGLVTALVAAAVLLAQIGLLLCVLVSPIALLAGIHPGVGRVLALRWAGLALGLLAKRVVLGALLAVVLVINGVLLDAAYPLGWLVVTGLHTLVVAAVIVYRKPFVRLLGPTTLPTLAASGRPAPAVQGRPGDHGEGLTSLRARLETPSTRRARQPGTASRRQPGALNQGGTTDHAPLPEIAPMTATGPQAGAGRVRRRVRDRLARTARDPADVVALLAEQLPDTAASHHNGNGHNGPEASGPDVSGPTPDEGDGPPR